MADKDQSHRQSRSPLERSRRLHPYYRGKIQMMPKVPIRDLADLSVWYTPGTAAAAEAVRDDPAASFEYTNRANTIAVISDGSRVLGLGDIGPAAGMPVMEGKALLFKYLGGVDAMPLCLDVADTESLIRTVKALEPSFGGINLEDISKPCCFRALERLRTELDIPVWHDDQEGTATVVTAALINALHRVGKSPETARIAMVGMGAANFANYRLLKHFGVDPGRVIACDSRGILHPGRSDLEAEAGSCPEKWQVCRETNAEGRQGGKAEALEGADVCIAFSCPGPGSIRPEWVAGMAADAVVFACANPVPEIWPDEAKQAGARIVATGRGGFPNQLNNSLAFPGLFRGVLDVRARDISNDMALAAARELAAFVRERGISDDDILPRMDEWAVFPRVALVTARTAVRQGLAREGLDEGTYLDAATSRMRRARESLGLLMESGLIEPMPEDEEEG